MHLGNRDGLDGTMSWYRERRPLDSQARLKGQGRTLTWERGGQQSGRKVYNSVDLHKLSAPVFPSPRQELEQPRSPPQSPTGQPHSVDKRCCLYHH